jgi:hypothetical protein
MTRLLAEAGSYILVWALGAGTALALRDLLRAPRPTTTPVEGIDGLHRALDADTAASDLPTQGLPRAGTGTVYTSRYR